MTAAAATSAMPDELRVTLREARALLVELAHDTDTWLEGFLEGCFASGDSDFNTFDRHTHQYEKQVAKLRWLLWEITDAARAAEVIVEPSPAADGVRADDAVPWEGP